MLIELEKTFVINMRNVSSFRKIGDKGLSFTFYTNKMEFEFGSEEKRDIAFDKILEHYRWQRMQCTLD
jgi:hypothetical protein